VNPPGMQGALTVSVYREVTQEAKLQSKRRGVRVNSRVPVSVAWHADAGSDELKVHTRVVGPYGCLAVIPREFSVEQQLEIVNQANLRSNAGVIVWKGNQRVEGWEYGIELIEPEMDFWGLEL
jgi:anti-sigma factor RsiW